MRGNKWKGGLGAVAAVFLAFGISFGAPKRTESVQDSSFSVQFIDVGQADAALVECDGHYMLIDGGNRNDSDLMYTFLKDRNVKHLDIVVGTHAHEDHIGGISGALHYADADVTLCPVENYDSAVFEDFVKYANQNGGGITVPDVGDQYSLGSAAVTVLGVNGGSETNDTSIVLKLQYGETAFLFTGDAEREAEQTILDSGADLSATVLKVGHHGGANSTTYPFLREIMPEYAVISVGANNSYGHPTDAVLSRLKDADVEVYRTDLQGTVTFSSNGKTVTVSTDKTAPQREELPRGADYVINTNSKKFHDLDCGSVEQIKKENKMYYTGTREELIVEGYDPCKNCNP